MSKQSAPFPTAAVFQEARDHFILGAEDDDTAAACLEAACEAYGAEAIDWGSARDAIEAVAMYLRRQRDWS